MNHSADVKTRTAFYAGDDQQSSAGDLSDLDKRLAQRRRRLVLLLMAAVVVFVVVLAAIIIIVIIVVCKLLTCLSVTFVGFCSSISLVSVHQ